MAALTGLLNNTWAVAAGVCVLTLPLAKKRNLRGARAKMWTSKALNADLGYQSEPIYCRLCGGSGQRPCAVCNETGSLARGGFAKKNTVRVSSMVGTKWTSVSAIDGKWRHFLCVGKKGRNAKDGVAVLSSTCGPVQNRIKVEVPVSELKNREVWEGGWTTLKDIRDGGVIATRCSACRGEKTVPCPRCDGLGQVGI